MALEAAAQRDQTTCRVGGYVRLSVENSGGKTEDSIENQKSAILTYLRQHPEFELCELYCDNGETGTNFARPGFERLLADIQKGRINCVLVKDLSRFGRNYQEVGAFIEKTFPKLGVRFISIYEQFDSLTAEWSAEGYIIPLRNIFNEMYAKDISLKSGSALRIKQAQGDFIGSWAAYGYQKDPQNRHRIIPDPRAASVVRQIFEWKAQGLGSQQIVHRLVEGKILSPSAYRYQMGLLKKPEMAKVPWRTNTIKIILQNQVYLGHTVQGRKQSNLQIGQKQTRMPEEEWQIVRNTHEPIIEEALFHQVQVLMASRAQAYQEKLDHMKGQTQDTVNVLKGLVVCAACGGKLTRYKNFNRTKHGFHVYYSYICPRHGVDCAFTSISEATLISVVQETLQKQLALALEWTTLLDALQKEKSWRDPEALIRARKQKLKKQLAEKESYCRKLFEGLASGLVDEAQFQYMQAIYKSEIAALQEELASVSLDMQAETEKQSFTEKMKTQVKAFVNQPLTYEMARLFIKEVIVSEDRTVQIMFYGLDEFEEIVRERATGRKGDAA
ncbi:recombinase family protein [Anaerotruncus rubiinfantis]|nr:recombinase family protein [Faecalicatena sp. BF-R-105]